MRRRFSISFIVAMVGAALFSSLVAGYLMGIRQVNPALGGAERTSRINLGPIHLRLTAGTMGLVIIFILGALVLIASLLAILAYRRRKRIDLVEKEKEETRRLANEELRASEDRYRMLFETMDEGFCVIEMVFDENKKPLDYRFLEVNPAFAKQTGLEDARGKSMRDLFPDHEEYWFEIYGKVVLTGEPVRFENFAKRLGRWFEVYAAPVGGAESPKVAITFNNITPRKEAEKKLREQLMRLDLLQQITRVMGERLDLKSIFGVVIRRLEDDLPVDFCCICVYDAASESMRVMSVGVKGDHLAKEMAFTEHASIDIDKNGLSRCLQGELVYEPDISSLSLPFAQRLARGGLRSLVMVPLLVEGKAFGVLLAGRNEVDSLSSGDCEFLRQLSEHVALAAHQAELYEALEKAYTDLRETQQAVMQQERLRALGQMASGIAHDINNAISPVMLYTESLLENEQNLSERGRNSLETIARAIDDVAATIARLREFYRLREPQLKLAPVQLNDLIQQVLDLTRARWSDIPQQRGIVIQTHTDLAPKLPKIMAAEGEIREALTNLVFNAVDAMPDGGTLTLRTRIIGELDPEGQRRTHNVQVEICDTGVGMDEETRRRCLEPFFTTKGERGTGLGLAMVYGVLERHSAEAEIDSNPGQGTTVRLIFSVPDTTATSSDTQTTTMSLLPQRILIVDDDPLVLNSLRDTLAADGHFVVGANGGQEGIDTFRMAHDSSEPFRVVITDLGMPYIDGRQVAGAIKKISPATPVILFTGWGQRLVADGDIPHHVDRVLSKPPKLSQLREVLANVCSL
ncbi:MAG TPA: ATP-binding protein [Pyrinomonadaceae bacterium]|nr:ATP-binding protein [Pyrinomonadaceae bacterium]